MNCELTKKCAFCGRTLLTLPGLLALHDDENPHKGALQGLETLCTCEQSILAGQRLQAEIEANKRQETARLKADRLKARFDDSNMPETWLDRGMGAWLRRTPNEQVAYEAAEQFGKVLCESKTSPSLYIAGPIGTGKTMLASCLACDLIRKGHTVRWSNVGDLLRTLRATFNDRSRNEEQVIDEFSRVPILVLDDLGKERPTEWAAEQLFALFNHRYDYNRPTIVTTNYSGADLVKRLTPRPDPSGYADDTTAQAIVDRLRGTAQTIILDGTSKR